MRTRPWIFSLTALASLAAASACFAGATATSRGGQTLKLSVKKTPARAGTRARPVGNRTDFTRPTPS
jgi:hypothetical protein